MADQNKPHLKCHTSMVIHTTSLAIESLIKEVTGYSYPLKGLLDSDKRFHARNIEIHSYAFCNKNWNHFKETGEISIFASVEDALHGLASDGIINYGIYHFELIEDSKIDLLSSDAKGILHDACVNVCNEIRHNKYSDLHQNMVDAVWEAANKVLRAHNKNNSWHR